MSFQFPTTHRNPFALVDRVLSVEIGVSAQALKNVTFNDRVFLGHFPGSPIYPGVLIAEGMSQVAQLAAGPGVGVTAKLDKFKFLKPVYPGDQILFKVTVVQNFGTMTLIKGTAFVDGQKICTGEITGVRTDLQV